MKKPLVIIVLAVLVLIGVFVILTLSSSKGKDPTSERDPSSSRSRRQDDAGSETLTEDSCLASGGDWNSCGSACRTTPDSPCIEVCVSYCECTSNAQCPTGLTCSDYVDNVGVCL